MPRPIWKGHISFGLVSIPVSLYSAEQRKDLTLHLIDSRDQSRIAYERVNSETGEEVPWNSIVRGYEFSKGNYVLLNDEELKRAAPEATKTIEIENFVKPAEISPLLIDKPYYVEPTKQGRKGYVLLRETLRDAGLTGIAKVVIRTRQYVATLSPLDDVLVLVLLRFAQEIRSTDGLDIPERSSKSSGLSPRELKVAHTLVESMTTPWDPKAYHDEYRDALMKWIDKKVASGELTHSPEPVEDEQDEPPAPLNFMALLEKSLEHASGRKPPGGSPGRSAGERSASSESAPTDAPRQRGAGRSAKTSSARRSASRAAPRKSARGKTAAATVKRRKAG